MCSSQANTITPWQVNVKRWIDEVATSAVPGIGLKSTNHDVHAHVAIIDKVPLRTVECMHAMALVVIQSWWRTWRAMGALQFAIGTKESPPHLRALADVRMHLVSLLENLDLHGSGKDGTLNPLA